jgi:hypothetical protein
MQDLGSELDNSQIMKLKHLTGSPCMCAGSAWR